MTVANSHSAPRFLRERPRRSAREIEGHPHGLSTPTSLETITSPSTREDNKKDMNKYKGNGPKTLKRRAYQTPSRKPGRPPKKQRREEMLSLPEKRRI